MLRCAPLRRRSGGPPLNSGLPEHTPKKRRTKEPAPSTKEQQFDSNLGSRLEQAVDDRHRCYYNCTSYNNR